MLSIIVVHFNTSIVTILINIFITTIITVFQRDRLKDSHPNRPRLFTTKCSCRRESLLVQKNSVAGARKN